MANRTVKEATSVKGTNPQYLIEKIVRLRVYDSQYWKEECFALTAELLVDKAMQLRYIGATYGPSLKPTPFFCLAVKMLQIQPDKDIIIEFIRNQDFKYLRALGAYYMRLTGSSLDDYNYLEPLLNDFRKLRIQHRDGSFHLIHMDEFIDGLLHEERFCDILLPRLQKRQVLEETKQLVPRVSALEDDLEDEDEEETDSGEENVRVHSGYSRHETRHEREPSADRVTSRPGDDRGGWSRHRRDRHQEERSHHRRRSSRDRHNESAVGNHSTSEQAGHNRTESTHESARRRERRRTDREHRHHRHAGDTEEGARRHRHSEKEGMSRRRHRHEPREGADEGGVDAEKRRKRSRKHEPRDRDH